MKPRMHGRRAEIVTSSVEEFRVIKAADCLDPGRSLEIGLGHHQVIFQINIAHPEGDRSFAVNITRDDFLAIMDHLRRHEAVVR